MNIRKITTALQLIFVSQTCLFASEKPNIIFILADDLGFEALGAYGGKNYKDLGAVKTPNLDRMAARGMKFTHCFATPVSSPARAEFLTGKYNFRIGFPDIAGRNGAADSLDVKAHPTVAQYLKKSGYTTAVCGKWHVGPPENDKVIPSSFDSETDFSHPKACGFDRQCIFGGAHLEKYWDSKSEIYTPEIIQKWTLSFLREPERKKSPFFLYYASPIPHVPLYATPLNPNGKAKDNSNFPFLIEYLDRQVGEILRTLEVAGLAENTIVIFSGDNGTNRIVTQMDNGREIKGAKGTLTDAGVNVPLIVSYPGKIAEGSICTNLVDFSDLMPTFLQLAGEPIPKVIDGISFYGQLIGQKSKPRNWVHSHCNGHYFVRNSDFKLQDGNALYSMKDAPYQEILIAPENDTSESKAARKQLQLVIDSLYKGYSSPYVSGEKNGEKQITNLK